MIIWLAVVLPLVLAAVLYVIWNHKIIWWELGIQVLVPILLTLGAKGCVEAEQTRATEYWGHRVESAAYFERWDEKVSCRHEISCSHTDKDGNTLHSNDGYQHSFDVDEHDPYWEVYVSGGGRTISVSQATFDRLVHQFGNRTFVNLHRRFYTINGNKFVTEWKGEWQKVEPVTVAHSYENRIQASKNVFNYAKVDPKDYGLFKHPGISGYTQRCVQGPGGPTTAMGEKKIEYLNAMLGAPHQVRLYVLVWKGQPIQAAMEQEAYWIGGNKNEFVTCIGLNDANEVQWCHVFSWTESDLLKAEARSFVISQKEFDLLAYADWLWANIPSKWVRRKFEEFNYLTVDPPLSAVIFTFILTLVVSAGIGIWSIKNGVDSEHERVSFIPKRFSLFMRQRKENV